jgi:hypothetical protein
MKKGYFVSYYTNHQQKKSGYKRNIHTKTAKDGTIKIP